MTNDHIRIVSSIFSDSLILSLDDNIFREFDRFKYYVAIALHALTDKDWNIKRNIMLYFFLVVFFFSSIFSNDDVECKRNEWKENQNQSLISHHEDVPMRTWEKTME